MPLTRLPNLAPWMDRRPGRYRYRITAPATCWTVEGSWTTWGDSHDDALARLVDEDTTFRDNYDPERKTFWGIPLRVEQIG